MLGKIYPKAGILCLLALIQAHFLHGQSLPGGLGVNGSITGRIIDSKSSAPIEYATIALFSFPDEKIIEGTISDKDGFFQLKDISVGVYSMEVSFIGYEKSRISKVLISPKLYDVKLGEIKLNEVANMLGEVNVTASRPGNAYKIDKKIINISNDLIVKGGTAADALETEPSVKTDLSGNVTLRGSSNYKILIDGRPSSLQGSDALQQIPAETIENIEIISNPSAQYDPNGEAGIINVILKKNAGSGYSGMISVSGGVNGKWGGNISLNRKSRRLNVSLALNTNSDPLDFSGNMYRETYPGDATLVQSFTTEGAISRQSFAFASSIEYEIDHRNIFILQRSSGEKTFKRKLDVKYSSLMIPENSLSYFVDETNYEKSSPYKDYNLSYLHHFDYSGHSLEASAYFSKLNDDKNNTLSSSPSDLNWVPQESRTSSQKSTEDNVEREFRVNINYANPFSSLVKLETGYQFKQNSGPRNYELEDFDNGLNEWIENIDLQNAFELTEKTHSGYGLVSGEKNSLGYKLGLRVEYFSRNLAQNNGQDEYNRHFLDLFPTVHFSWKFPRDLQLQASYSRRINQPSHEQLTPFVIYADKQTYRLGNPALKSEYTNSYELNVIKRVFLSFYSVQFFYKQIRDKITPVRSLNSDTTMRITYQNMNEDYSLGIELAASMPFNEWWRLTASSSLFRYNIEGDLMDQPSGNSSVSVSAKLSSGFKFKQGTQIQLNAFYNGERATAQGSQQGFIATSVAVKQDFFKNVLNLTFQVRDVFHSTKFSSVSKNSSFYSRMEFRPHTPLFLLTCSMRFNKYKKAQQSNEINKIEIDDLLNE